MKSAFWFNVFQCNYTQLATFRMLFWPANIMEYKVYNTINYCKEKREKQKAWFELS